MSIILREFRILRCIYPFIYSIYVQYMHTQTLSCSSSDYGGCARYGEMNDSNFSVCPHYESDTSLPFAIVEFMGWFTIPIVTFISYGILGVVCNAVELEDPFGSGTYVSINTHTHAHFTCYLSFLSTYIRNFHFVL